MDSKKKKDSLTIPILMVVLLIYNVFYWSRKFLVAYVPSFVASFYVHIKEHWGLMTFLEFLAVASVVVDTVAKFDVLKGGTEGIRIFLSLVLLVAFIAHFLLGMIDIYFGGGVR